MIPEDVQQIVANLGLKALGLASPLLSVRWTDTGDLTTPMEGAAGTLSLISGKTWMAPAAGFLAVQGGADRILMPQGTPAPADAAVLRLHPQVYLRLVRLYASVIEGLTDKTHRPQRPVPYYYVFTARGNAENPESGEILAGESLKLTGTLTIHDVHGLAIDPVAVAAAFDAFLDKFDVLEAKDLLSTSSTPQDKRQIHAIGKLGAQETRIHLVDPHGKPQDGANLEKLTVLDAASGLFRLDAAGTTITRSSGAPDDLRIGPATTGTLDSSFAVPKPTPTLHRDFLRAMVVDLKPFLIGDRPAADPAADVEPLPEVRHNESVTFSLNGNAVLGVANEILKGSPDVALMVSPALQGDFAIPADGTDAKAQWPHFPAGLPQTIDPIPASLRGQLDPAAHFLDGTEADVVLTLKGLTPGQAVRVYPRVFLPDAREGRRDGAGAVAGSTGEVVLVLRDPLGRVKHGHPTTLPPEPVLHVDAVVVNSAGRARVFGNLVTAIGPSAPLPSTPPVETNPFGSGEDRGIASAGILGLPAPPLPPGGISTLEDLWKLARALGSEGSPRDAPRLPTMARRSAIVASGSSGTWHGQLSGAHLVPASRHARPRLANPGNPGGKELHTVSAQARGGLLAYDLARAAQRRTRDIVTRLIELEKSRWDPPQAATGGTVSGAVLHTVAPVAETPELSPYKTEITKLPATWEEFVDKVKALLPSSTNNLPKLEDTLNDLRDSAKGKRLYAEMKRELSASVHGRRDALRALTRAVSSARSSIYLEGPAFTATEYGPDAEKDLVKLLEDRLKEAPGLRVVLCVSKELDYGPGYETFAAREHARRLDAVARLRAAAPGRVVAFHPIGFPGRALRLMTGVVVVDDLWALVGTSSFRRRGLTFDEGLDLVLFDRNLEEGRGAAVADLRRRLMAGHLGVAAPHSGEIPHPSWVALADGYQAFSVFQELLGQEGAGLIERLWDGKVPGVPMILSSDFPVDAVADPEGREIESTAALLLAALSPVTGPALPP